MHIWPFNTVLPEQFDALSEAERQMLEAITQAFLAEIELQRMNGMRPAPG